MAPTIRLLLVESNDSDRRLIRKALRGHTTRFRVSDVSNLREVSTRIDNGRFDIALIDLDGWPQPFDALDRVHRLAPDLPVAVLSRTDVAADAVQRGADGFVMKTEQDLALLHVAIPAVIERAEERRQSKALLRQLQASELRYRLLFDNVQDALLLCDAGGKILQVNQSAQHLLDRSGSDLVGTSLMRWLSGSTQPTLAELTGPEPVPLSLKHSSIAVQARASSFTLDDQSAFLVILRDLRREERSKQLLRALTAASAAMQGALTPADVFRAAGEQLRSIGLVLSVFRYLEDENALVMMHTELAQRVLAHTQRATGLDPMKFHIRLESSPTLQAILASDVSLALPDSAELIREMLPSQFKRLAGALQKVMGYREQFALRLSMGQHVYGLITVGYPEGKLLPEDQPVVEAFASQMQAALERAQRFEITQTRLAAKLRQLTHLVQVGEQMQLRQSLDTLLDSFCDAIRESLEWDRVTIWLRDEPTATLHPRDRQGVSTAHRRRSDGLDEKVWRQDAHRINRSYFLPQGDAEEQAWQPGDLLLTPIEIGGQLLGAIQVDQPVSGLRPMPDDLTPLELFANQAAVALENVNLYERTRAGLKQRTAELTSLTTLSAVADQGDLKASLEQALFQVLHVSGMDAASIALLVPATGELQPYVGQGLSDALWNLMTDSATRIGEGVGGRALAAGNAIVVTDVPTDPRVPYRDRLIEDGIQTVVGVGLAGRSPVGSMTLYGYAPRHLADETLDWITVAGRQIALSIENTRLIESTRRRQQMAEAVREVNAAVASSLELDAVLDTIFDQIKRVVQYDTSSILLAEAESLRVIAARGPDDPSEAVGYAHPRDERNPAWQAVLNREVQVVADVTAIEDWRGELGAKAMRSWIGAPLIVHNEVIGLLTLDHHEPRFYTSEDARNASLIAQQAAVAIDNARRFEIERERSERLRLMNDLGRELIVALERDAILGLVAEYIAERFGYAQVDVWLLDPEANELLCRVDNGVRLSSDHLEPEWRMSPDEGIIGHAASTGQTYLCGNVDVDPYFVPNPVSAITTRSELAVPLRIEERVAGVLNVESVRLNAFSEDDVVILQTLAGQIGAALAIAELYQETQERAGNLSLLFAASQELSSSLDSDQVFGRLAQWIVSAVEATSARVYIWDLSTNISRLLAQYVGARAGVSERQSMVGMVQALNTMPILVESMKAHDWVAHNSTDLRQPIDLALQETLATANVTSALYLPLIVRERLIGCVEIWETQRSRAWRPDEIHMCQTVANVAASAIDNARLFEVERQRRAVAETMRELAAVVSSSLELQPILESLLDRAAELIPYDSAMVFIAQQTSSAPDSPGELRIEASRGLASDLLSGAVPSTPENPVGEVFRTGEVSICADVRERDDWTTLHAIEHVRAWLGAPLKVKDQVIGVLTFDSRSPGRYRHEHGEIAETIANHAAVAIENAQLYQETSQRLAELETLQAVSLELIQSLDVKRVSQAIADGALRLLKATAVHLFSFDAGSDSLQMVAVSAARGFEEVGQPTPRREGLTMQVAHRGQAVVVNDPENDPAFAPITRATAAQGAKALVGLPLQVRGRVLGVMNVLFHVPHTIVDNEVRILGLLADQAATALENARLFQTEERRARQLAVVNRVGLDITSILDLDQLTQRVVEEIRNAFGYYYVGVAMVEGDTVMWRASAGGDMPGWTAAGVRRPIGDGIVGLAATSGEPILVGDVSLDPRYFPITEISQTRSEMALPLKAKGTVLGVLDVESERTDAFGKEDLAVLTALTSQLSVAVENALLYEAQAQYAASLEARVAERTADIRREQERTITILNSVADAVLVTDLDGVIVLTNPVAETLLQEDQRAEQPGRLQDWLRELSPAVGASKIDIAGRTMQAAVAYISEDDRKVGHVMVLRDITLLEEVDRLKTQFVTNVSHELRTPLTNVKLYLGLFQKGKPEKREQYLITLQDEVDRLERLISDLLDLSRLERDRQTVTHDVIDLVGVLQHVVTTLGPQAEAKQQTLLLEIDESPLWVPADRNHMIQVFINLTANAINYTPAGGQAKLKASIAERDARKWVVVAVSDNGVGIPDEDRDRVFDRFYRGQAEHLEVRGTGLGLSIVSEIVNQHSGQITLESRVGKGSTFTVWLPAH